MWKKLSIGFLAVSVLAVSAFAQKVFDTTLDSGGKLMPEQAAYDVKKYDLAITPNIDEQSIKGVLTVTALIVKPLDKFVLDLDPVLTVDEINLTNPDSERADVPLKFVRKEGKLWIDLPQMEKAGATITIRIDYGGKPRVAPQPPWVGGFVWKKTADGSPWVGVAVQGEGADLWFPVKDHPSDEAETVALHYTVPKTLVAAGNGKLQSVVENADETHTFNWLVSQPINNYDITMDIAPYKLIEDSVKSVAGEMIPIRFYVLPEHYAKGQSLVDLVKKYVQFYEQYEGPYPFRADKIGIVETSYLGMEHQTLTAYGNNFRYDADGHDWLLFHEFGHEWWGNMLTGKDWNDFWLHEGFQSFMDTFYIEKTKGKAAYFAAMEKRHKPLNNVRAIAPRESQTTTQMYFLPPDYKKYDGDIYDKGALVLNSLRFYLGDETFFKVIRRWAYPTPESEKITDGRQTRLVTTDEFIKLAEKVSGKKSGWFFDVYARQPKLPKLISEVKGNQLLLHWETPDNLPFPMPVEVEIAGKTTRVEMKNGKGSIAIPTDAKYTIDPRNWDLKEAENGKRKMENGK